MAAVIRLDNRPRERGFWLVVAALGVVLAAALGAAEFMESHGHVVTGMNNQVVWGLPHVFAFFLIVTASGALNVASIASVFGEKAYKPLAQFDLKKLGAALKPERDLQFGYLGLQTLYDRYFLVDQYVGGRRFELPQCFFMRVAMGLALNEVDREARAIEFYNVLSTFDFMSSTPTLFNSGTLRPQLSSCYLTTVPDDLDGIFSSIKDDALLSKFAGGLGNDWTRVRAMGAHIKGTNGKSQGVVPFLKVVNDTAVAVNQGGKRKGAVCAYLESWHLDVEEFLELRKNTGDDRRRTHDMNTANWIPDLFMKRVMEGGKALVSAVGEKKGDTWSVTFTRKLSGGEGDVTLAEGKLQPFGFAIHDEHAGGRFHHVSFGYTLGLGTKGDVTAAKQ